jgi:hypothetical protein
MTPSRLRPSASTGHAGAFLLAASLALSGCGGGPAGPEDQVLVGQFGAADVTIELLATRAGVELVSVCGDYFISDDAALLDESRTFEVAGTYHYTGPVVGGPADATLSGYLASSGLFETVTVTLLIGGGGPTVDPLVLTLRRGHHYEGLPLPCPA